MMRCARATVAFVITMAYGTLRFIVHGTFVWGPL